MQSDSFFIFSQVEQQITNSKIVLPPFEEKTPENSMLAKEEMPSKVMIYESLTIVLFLIHR